MSEQETTENNQTSPARPQEILYDAMAEQRIPFEKTYRDKKKQKKRCIVYHTFKAIGGKEGDTALIEYDRRRDVRMAAGGGGSVDARSDMYTASLFLWPDRIVRVEGWGAEDGADVKDKDRADAVQDGLLACDIVEPALAELADVTDDKPWEHEEETDTSLHLLRARFGENVVVTEHELAQASRDQEKRFNVLMTRTKLQPGEQLGKQETQVPSRWKALGKLYMEMRVSVKGYVKDIVPLHHQVEVVMAHMSTEMEALEGN